MKVSVRLVPWIIFYTSLACPPSVVKAFVCPKAGQLPSRANIPKQARTTSHKLSMSILPHDFTLAVKQSSNLLEAYGALLRVYPLVTKSVTASLLAFVGDSIAQYSTALPKNRREEQSANLLYDWKRGLTFLFFGAVYTGVLQHFWFNYLNAHVNDWGQALHIWGPERASLPLDTVVSTKEWWRYFDVVTQFENPPSSAMLAAAKVAINQFLVIPTVYMPLFFLVTSNFDAQMATERAKTLYLKLLSRNYVYWLPMQFCQFFLLPSEWQIPFLSIASLVWTVILSSIGSSSSAQSDANSQLNTALPSELNESQLVDTVTSSGDITEFVSLEDVREALIPSSLNAVLDDEKVQSVATGLTLGLVSSAADEGALGGIVGSMVQGEIETGVAISAALVAGTFLLSTMQGSAEKNTNTDNIDVDTTEE